MATPSFFPLLCIDQSKDSILFPQNLNGGPPLRIGAVEAKDHLLSVYAIGNRDAVVHGDSRCVQVVAVAPGPMVAPAEGKNPTVSGSKPIVVIVVTLGFCHYQQPKE